ncbi:MAG: O-acetyl-ADP-ribose deacetylase [Clostridia bacterium]|nr:O-acetyl-ADP-ribose deacetylase [Clostridia bacterium]
MGKFSVVKGDIVKSKTDAIVNAANTSLLGGGGVDGAIHRAAGRELLEECEKLGGCKTGEAKITKGYKLNAKYVIHTPGPIWRGGTWGEAELLASCYRNCLKLALENDIKTIAFPSISTGVYRFPVEQAAEIAVNEIVSFMYEHNEIEQVNMVCYDDTTYKAYKKAYENAIAQ